MIPIPPPQLPNPHPNFTMIWGLWLFHGKQTGIRDRASLPVRRLHFLHEWNRLQFWVTRLSNHVTFVTMGTAVQMVTTACSLFTHTNHFQFKNQIHPLPCQCHTNIHFYMVYIFHIIVPWFKEAAYTCMLQRYLSSFTSFHKPSNICSHLAELKMAMNKEEKVLTLGSGQQT